MKRNAAICCLLVGVIACISLLVAVPDCDKETTMRQTFTIHDFETIEVGTSTFRDVYAIATPDQLTITSYGSMCEYPATDGGTIRIEFLENEMTVGSIRHLFEMD